MKDVTCIRKECIEDAKNSYHFEEHICFVCGGEFDPTIELLEENLCLRCNWYKCPRCGGCQCTLSKEDREWIQNIRETYCHSICRMSSIEISALPETINPNVKKGLGLQLYFCKAWARQELAEEERKGVE